MNNDNIEIKYLTNIASYNLENILLYNFDNFDNNLNLVQRLLALNNRYIRDIVNDLLISNNNLLFDIIMYIKLNNINILFSNNYYIKLFSKWQDYKNSRVNIYYYINNCIKPERNVPQIALDINNYGDLIKQSQYIINIPQCYKDSKNKITNYDIAIYHIKLNKGRVYPKDISPNLLYINDINNFNLLCIASKKHVSAYSLNLGIKSYDFTESQMIQLIKHNPLIYQYMPIRFKNNVDILEYIICNSLKAYTMITIRVKKTFDKLQSFVNNLIININTKIDSLEHNKNYIYFVLSYITHYPKNIELISNNLHNNILYNKCFELIEPYLHNDYILFAYKYLKSLNATVININYTTLKTTINTENISNMDKFIINKYISEYNLVHIESQIINNEWYYYQYKSFINFNTKKHKVVQDEIIYILLQLDNANNKAINVYEYRKYLDNIYFPIINNIRYNELLLIELLK